MAAGIAAEKAEVVIFEKNDKLLKKLYITGKGRCNITNASDGAEFLSNVVRGGRFLFSALKGFSPADTIEFFRGYGLDLKVERGNRVFPKSDKSSDIIKVFERFLNEKGAEIRLNCDVSEIKKTDDGRFEIILKNGNIKPQNSFENYPKNGNIKPQNFLENYPKNGNIKPQNSLENYPKNGNIKLQNFLEKNAKIRGVEPRNPFENYTGNGEKKRGTEPRNSIENYARKDIKNVFSKSQNFTGNHAQKDAKNGNLKSRNSLENFTGNSLQIPLENPPIPEVFDAVVIAAGGLSYPSTGSAGAGYKFAESFGHKIVPLCPALSAVKVLENVKSLEGLSLKNVLAAAYYFESDADEKEPNPANSKSVKDNKTPSKYAKNNAEYPKNNAQYPKNNAEYAKNNTEYPKNGTEYAKNNAEYAKNNIEYAKNNVNYAKNGGEYAKNNTEYPKNGKIKEIFSEFGEMLFTGDSLSGPLILSMSSRINRLDFNALKICIDLKPALSKEALDDRILRDFKEFANKNFSNALDGLLPKSLIPYIIEVTGIPPSLKVNEIDRAKRRILVETLKNLTFTPVRLAPIENAIVTSGGAELSEINPKTMESKLVKNLFFVGETLDIDALTGGFNLQIAMATGYACGKSIAERE
jgi:predicted flavoprotein YhiN